MGILKNLRRFLVLIIAIVIAASAAGAYFYSVRKPDSDELIEVRRGTVTEEVTVTGQVKPVTSADLAFEKGGKIARIYAKVGDRITAGAALVELDHADLDANLLQTQARVKAAEAKLAELKSGTRPEEIKIQEVKTGNAAIALEDAKRNLLDKLQDAYTKSDDAVRNKTDQFINNPRGSSPTLNFSSADSQTKLDIERARITVEPLLTSWQSLLLNSPSSQDLSLVSETTKNNLTEIKDYLAHIAYALNSVTSGVNLSQATLDAWRADTSTARTNVNTAIANHTAAVEKMRSAQASLLLEQNELALKKAGATAEQIKAQEAAADEARAAVASAQADLAKAFLRASVSGTVTRQDAKIGEIIAPQTVVVSIISENAFEIEANIPEVDVGRIKIGNSVSIVYDAFPGQTLKGTLIHIDPAETIIDGVVNFKVKIAPDPSSLPIRSGLTANCSIEARKKENVLTLPQYALSEKETGVFVKKRKGGAVEEVPVTVGIRGTGGVVEILSGVSEGEQVLNIGLKNGEE